MQRVEFLTKPFRETELLEAIGQALQKARRSTAEGRGRKGDAVSESSTLTLRPSTSALEESLLALHSAANIASFWKAVQRVVEASIVYCNVGLTLQHNPIFPEIAYWMRPVSDEPVNSSPLKAFLRAHPQSKLVRTSDVFPNAPDRSSLVSFCLRVFHRFRCLH
jgi:hypothetical protein